MPSPWRSGVTATDASSRVPAPWTRTWAQATTDAAVVGDEEPAPVEIARVELGRADELADRLGVGLGRGADERAVGGLDAGLGRHLAALASRRHGDLARPEPAVRRGLDGRRHAALGRHPGDGDGGRGRRASTPLWISDHLGFGDPTGEWSGAWESMTLLSALAVGRAAGPARDLRDRDAAAQPGAAREDGRDARRGQRRAVHPRPRRRLERARVHGVRGAVRAPLRRVRGGAADHRRDVPRRARGPRRDLVASAAAHRSRRAARDRRGRRS